MNLGRVVLSCMILALPAMVPTAAIEQENTNEPWHDLWVQQTGTSVPDHVARDLAELEPLIRPSDVAALMAAGKADDTTAYGDVWSVCLSATVGCSVADISGTFDPHCETYPVSDKFWVYRTSPAVLEFEATGDARGAWNSHTFHEGGGFTNAVLTGMSCVVFDKPHLSVVRTNGKADFQP